MSDRPAGSERWLGRGVAWTSENSLCPSARWDVVSEGTFPGGLVWDCLQMMPGSLGTCCVTFDGSCASLVIPQRVLYPLWMNSSPISSHGFLDMI